MSTFTVQVNCPVQVNRTVDLFSRWGQSSNYNYDVYYQINNPNATGTYWGTVSNTTCGNLDTILVPTGSTLYLYAVEASFGDRVYIKGADTGTCPNNLPVTCTYSTTITADSSVAITVYVDSNGDPQYCT